MATAETLLNTPIFSPPIGGKQYELSYLTLGDLTRIKVEARRWMEAEAKYKITQLVSMECATPENRTKVAQDMFDQLDSGVAEMRYLKTPEGTALAAWLSARWKEPTLSLDTFLNGINHTNVLTWQREIDKLAFPSVDATNEEEIERPNDKAPRTTAGQKSSPSPQMTAQEPELEPAK